MLPIQYRHIEHMHEGVLFSSTQNIMFKSMVKKIIKISLSKNTSGHIDFNT